MNFTPEQHAIFTFVREGKANGIIDAVAGAGKTTTIIECARHIPETAVNVLFCAFNKSIQKEIAERLSERGLTNVVVKTVHALGWQLLTSNGQTGKAIEVDESKYDKLIKSSDIQNLLRPHYETIMRINGLKPELADEDKYEAFAIRSLRFNITRRLININQKFRATLTKATISDFKNLVTHFGIFNDLEIKKAGFDRELECYFSCSMLLLKVGNDLSQQTMIMDFTDMIYLPYEWKLQSPVKYDFLFVDECQDLSKAQLAVALKYGHERTRILSVGDPRQSIYGFTGADIESFENVKKFTLATPLPLTTCFRCPKKVIELARSIRADIIGTKTEEGNVSSITPDKIIELAKPDDLIISRLRAPLLILVFGFIDKDRKVQIHEDEVKEIIREIRNLFKQEELHINLLTSQGGFQELKKVVLKRLEWIIRKDAERIINPIERSLHIESEVEYLKQKLEFLHRKYEQWKLQCPTVSDIIEKIRTYVSASSNSVKLATIHRAKGLENDRVFILSYDELPLQHLEQKAWERVQELNLKYVAVTRAKQELFLVRAAKVEVLEEKSLFDILPFDKQ
jgi:DNA helicase-2/ATP-dependent DNA helicase PcrA